MGADVDVDGRMNIVDITPKMAGVPRDGRDRPLVVPKAGGKPKAHTRTTTFIDCIEDKSNLSDWKMRQTLVGAALKPSLLTAVGELDPEAEDYKKRLTGLAEAALDASGANDRREKGTDLHALSEIVDEGKPLPEGLGEADLMDMAAYALTTQMAGFKMLYAEKFVVCPPLTVAGTPDRIVEYAGPGPDGTPIEDTFIFDTKTSRSMEYGGLKFAAQLGIYSRAEFYDWTKFPVNVHDKTEFARWKKTAVDPEEAAAAYSPLPPVNQEWGIIINLPSGSGDASLWWVDLTLGWEMAELALVIREARSKSKRAVKPFASVLDSAA